MISELLHNPFFSGGLAVVAAGWCAAACRDAPKAILRWIKNRLLLTAEIDNSDCAFAWVKQWLAANSKSRWMGINAVFPDGPGTGPVKPDFSLFPISFCWLRFRGRRIVVWVERKELQMQNGYRELITLQCLGRDKKIFEELLEEAYRFAKFKNGSVVEVWVPSGPNWQLADRKPIRRVASVVLPGGKAEALIADAVRFIGSKAWYFDRGIPWRRGYLLHGPPGNGKSSLAHAMASELGRNLCVLSLSSFKSDNDLIECLIRTPSNSVLLIEDVDAAWKGRDSNHDLTFSGLLNAIDGVVAKEGQILMMTTNHRDKLDGALVRPGRADVHLLIDDATEEQAAAMYRRFMGAGVNGDAAGFAKEMAGRSMAAIQERLLSMREASDAVDGCRKNGRDGSGDGLETGGRGAASRA